jgi:hypothetical protein
MYCFCLLVDIQSRGGGGSGGGRSDEVDLRMLVHQSQAGCIIGKSGFKIKELREVSYKLCVSQRVLFASPLLCYKLSIRTQRVKKKKKKKNVCKTV